MSKIYQKQTYLTIFATVGQDITDATVKIAYKKPSNITGTWNATIVNAVTGEVKYVIENENDLNEYGEWDFWAEVTFASGKKACGEPYSQYIYKCGQ